MLNYIFGDTGHLASRGPWWDRIEVSLLQAFEGEHAVGWLDARPLQWYNEIWWIQSGCCSVRMGNRDEVRVEAGEAMVLSSGEERSTRNCGAAPLQAIGICFGARLLTDFHIFSRFHLPVKVPLKNDNLANLLQQITNELRESTPAYNFTAPGLANLAIAEILRWTGSEAETPAQFQARMLAHSVLDVSAEISTALHYIETFYPQAMHLADMAQVAHLSPRHFSIKFKTEVRMSPMDYLRLFRLQMARNQLVSSEISIAQIAFDCGMDDPSYFSRAFKAQYGCTPLEMRKSKRNPLRFQSNS